MNPIYFPFILLALILFSSIKILREYERGTIFLLGKFYKVKGPGIIIVIPGIFLFSRVRLLPGPRRGIIGIGDML